MLEKYAGVEEVSTVHGAGEIQKCVEDHHWPSNLVKARTKDIKWISK